MKIYTNANCKNEVSRVKMLYIYALAAANIGAAARIFDIIFSETTYICMALIILSIIISAIILARRSEYRPLFVFSIFAITIIAQKIAYSAQADVGFNIIGGLDIALCLQFIVFCALRVYPQIILKSIYIASASYVIIYIFSTFAITAIPTKELADVSGVMGADSARETRVVLATSFAVFVVYYAISQLRQKVSLFHIISATLGIAALALSHSRVAQGLFVATLILFIPSSFIRKTASVASALVFIAVFLVACIGIIDYRFNPFIELSHDDSAWARANEYTAAIRILGEHPLTGAGLGSSTTLEYQMYINSGALFFPNDLGALGIWIALGLPGLVIFFACTYLCFFWWHHFNVSEPLKSVLFSVGIMNGLYGIIAPTIFMASGRVFLAFFIFLYLEHLSRRRAARHSAVPVNVGSSLNSRVNKKPFVSAS
ncbi:O-Antigen ligase [Rhodoblastus acidophilus]|uniref:O-Antigen ligase n=1 Tax=Rhodoblastus acidophilus TaxID=1074 RepID=A0A212Q1J3_RHOAC|nr:O-antigen ligase family protein [Rhodoblastus acidophilus]PPQ38784.1 hypothetical protein CKO16_09250 [Rhodoblastus acidophilus]RAI20438.1 hypothetical protein CH337_09480 [Rhodoblastus acidophilus]SNB53143.1 O-Antigen ligase [Rhodoblastus acidophilus]